MLLGGLMAAIYIFKVLNLAFVQEDIDSPPPDCRPVPVRMALPGLVLAILAVSLGFNAELLLDLLAVAGGNGMAGAG